MNPSFQSIVALKTIYMWSSQQFSTYNLKTSRNVQLKTEKWKLLKAGVCQAMTEDVNGA